MMPGTKNWMIAAKTPRVKTLRWMRIRLWRYLVGIFFTIGFWFERFRFTRKLRSRTYACIASLRQPYKQSQLLPNLFINLMLPQPYLQTPKSREMVFQNGRLRAQSQSDHLLHAISMLISADKAISRTRRGHWKHPTNFPTSLRD